jgi:hypothetical protein
MNPYLAIVLLAAVGYFASSVIKSGIDSWRAPKDLFKGILSGLEEFRRSHSWITKPNDSTYMVWPKGIVHGVDYPGNLMSYIQPDPRTNTFVVTAYLHHDKKWEKLKDESGTLTPSQLLLQLNTGIAMPASMRQAILSKVAGPAPELPAHRPHH